MSPEPQPSETPTRASKRGLERHVALDGTKPRDFSKDWPFGPMVAPEKFDSFEGMTIERQNLQLAAVRLLSQLVKDYLTYLHYAKTTQNKVAEATGLSPATLSALRNGLSWPSFPTYGVLRAYLPTHAEMNDVS